MNGMCKLGVRDDVETPCLRLYNPFGKVVVCVVAVFKDVLGELDAAVLENGATCSFGEDISIIGVKRE